MSRQGHTADAVRDGFRLVCGNLISFHQSEQIAEHILKHLDAIDGRRTDGSAANG